MTFEEAKAILGDWIDEKGRIDSTGQYVWWDPTDGDGYISLDDPYFSAETLMAIAVYVKEYPR